MSQITIRGRISTTSLARGETAVVEHTETIDRLIAGGFVEPVEPLKAAEPEPVTVEPAPSDDVSADDAQTDDEAVREQAAPKRTARKKTSS